MNASAPFQEMGRADGLCLGMCTVAYLGNDQILTPPASTNEMNSPQPLPLLFDFRTATY